MKPFAKTIKPFAKKMLDFCALVIVSPFVALHYGNLWLFSNDSFFVTSAQFLSLIPGKLGGFLRKNFFRVTMTHCSQNCLIGFGTLFSQCDTEICDGVYIGPQCNIGKCRIEKNCLLGSGVHILSGKGQHNFDDLETPIQEQGGSFEQITIGEDTWIGNGAIIMANVGKKCVIGAGSVVIKDIPDYAIVGGNPAKVLKSRLDLATPDSSLDTPKTNDALRSSAHPMQ